MKLGLATVAGVAAYGLFFRTKGDQARVGDRVDVKTADLQGLPQFVPEAAADVGMTVNAVTVRIDGGTSDAVTGPIVGLVGTLPGSGIVGETHLDFTQVEGSKFPQGIGPVSILRSKVAAVTRGGRTIA